MNRLIKKIALATAAVALVGCQTVPQEQKQAIQQLKAQQADTTDSGLHLDLAREYLKTAEKVQSIEYTYKAVEELETFSKKEPQHLDAKLMRYQLYYDFATHGDVIMTNKLIQLFAKLPPEVLKKVNPPSLAQAVFKIRSEGYLDKYGIRQLLKKSIKDQPYSVRAHVMLADMYAYDDKFNLAIPIMAKITERQPKDPFAARVYAEIVIDSVEYNCAYARNDPYKKALEQLRKAKKLKPDDPEIHANLGIIYGNMGRYVLSLNAFKKFNQLQDDIDSKAELISAFIDSGKTDQARELIEQQIADGAVSPYFYEQSARFYFLENEWERSGQVWKDYFASTKRHGFYDVLTYSYIDEKLNGRDVALKNFSKKSNGYTDKWHRQLRAYRLGELSKADLYLKTNNACEMTEANFNIAMDFYVRGERAVSKKYLQEVLNDKIYGFVEYKAAKYLLADM